MRGKRKFFESQIDNIEVQQKRGRSIDLIDKRNRALVSRYYFYLTYSKLRYDSIIEKLSAEFFISSYRAADVLNDNTKYFDELKCKKPSCKELDKLFPQMKWSNELTR